MAEEHLIVDGYNVLYAWPELKCTLRKNMALAREDLILKLVRYADMSGARITIVFDGKTQQGPDLYAHLTDHSGVEVVFSTNGQTADSYIERLIFNTPDKTQLCLVSSDRAVRDFACYSGARTLSAGMLSRLIGEC